MDLKKRYKEETGEEAVFKDDNNIRIPNFDYIDWLEREVKWLEKSCLMKNLPIIIIFLLDITMPFIMLIFHPNNKIVHYLCFMATGLIFVVLFLCLWMMWLEKSGKLYRFEFEEAEKTLDDKREDVLRDIEEHKLILQSILDDINKKRGDIKG